MNTGQLVERLQGAESKILKSVAATVRAGLTRTLQKVNTTKLSGQVLNRRTGALMDSGNVSVEVVGSEVVGKIGYTVPYARIHEYGGTIRPRRADGWLRIPLPLSEQYAGRPTFVIKSRRGNLVVVVRDGKGIIPVAALKKSVVIPARPYLGPTMEEDGPALAAEAMAEMGKQIEGALK